MSTAFVITFHTSEHYHACRGKIVADRMNDGPYTASSTMDHTTNHLFPKNSSAVNKLAWLLCFQKLIARKPISYFLSNQLIELSESID